LIQSFLQSWDLFHYTYLAGWLIGLLLALVGVLAVTRDQIFIGAAMSQTSTLGIAASMWLVSLMKVDDASWFASDTFRSVMAVAFSVAAALVTSRNREAGGETHEALTGWLFLISASLSILIVSHSPHGIEEVHRIVSSSIIGAGSLDVETFAALVLVTAAAIAIQKRKLLLFALDPVMAAAVGMRVGLWALITTAWMGLCVGLSIRVSGMLYTFGCLVLPALVAKNICREVRFMFVVAPIVFLVNGTVAFALANYYDFPPAHMTIALLAVTLTGAWLARYAQSRFARA
jgi:ABC-type Mn2+/Zn2+ transport system permease subunit